MLDNFKRARALIYNDILRLDFYYLSINTFASFDIGSGVDQIIPTLNRYLRVHLAFYFEVFNLIVVKSNLIPPKNWNFLLDSYHY